MVRNIAQKNRDSCLMVARNQGLRKEAGRKRRRDVRWEKTGQKRRAYWAYNTSFKPCLHLPCPLAIFTS